VGQEGAEHVVRSAAQLARQLAVSWHAVYVETPSLQRLEGKRRERILKAVQLAQELGARTAVLADQDIAGALLAHARRNNLYRLVMGHGDASPWWPKPNLGQEIARLAPDIDRIEVGRARSAQAPASVPVRPVSIEPGTGAGLRRYALAAIACALTTLLASALFLYFDLANIVMVFLLSGFGVAAWLGRGPAILAAFGNVAAFDFFFVPPRFSFAVSDVQYLLTFAVMLIVGLVTGQLTAGMRFQARVAAHREARSRALFEAARDLSNTLTTEQATDVARAVVSREFRAEVAVFVLGRDDQLRAPGTDATGLAPGTAQWVLDHNQAAGLGTDTLAGSAWLYLPLKATMRSRGVLAVKPARPRFLRIPEQRQQLETFAALTALALERIHYVEVAQSATLQMESERLRNSLLAALSHDLRTPLAALVGTAETLTASHPPLSATQREMASSIGDMSRRTADMVSKLLDMARLQSGEVRLRTEWQSIEEIIGSALTLTRSAITGRTLGVEIDPAVSLVECDAVLIERVLANLLENAGKYTPAGTPLEILVRRSADELLVGVRDHGAGVPANQEEIIFEKFTRGSSESATPGVGLGLAICRAIVQAHRGRIWVEPTHPTGATFTFSLPLGTPPPIDLAEDAPPVTGATEP